jgi:phosphoribosylaminoimidazole-succinocarboxamide synthase
MEFGPQIAAGKTKIVYAHPADPTLAVLQHKDGITAGDGVRRNEIPGKGAIAGRTTANVFALLARAGIATHFVAAPSPDLTVVRRCAMIPLEVVMRRLATGSYLKRHPEVAEGTRFEPPLVEFFLKDDARHDPQISEAAIAEQAIASASEVAQMISVGRAVFATIEAAWAAQEVTLVDLKIEFGRAGAELIVADVIDNDSWRIWPGGEKARMLDKQVYRNAQVVDEELLGAIRQRYEQVADLTGRFLG